MQVTADAPCVLTISQVAYPGWQAAVDGAATPVLTSDGVLQAVAVPAGTHTVTLHFQPQAVLTGAIISLLTLVAAAIGLLAARLVEGQYGAGPATPRPE